MQNKIITLIIAILFAQLALSQNNSPYTRYGLGSLNSTHYGPSRAMGGVSLAYSSGRNLNYSNPASLSCIDSLSFIFEFEVESGFRQLAMLNPNLKSTYTDTKLSYLAFGFPITKWWGSSLGIMPFSTVGYNIKAEDDLFDVSKTYFYEGSGGINQVYWNNGFELFSNFRLGLSFSYLFGMQNRSNSVKFNDDSGAYVNVLEENIIYINDFNISAGAQYDIRLNDKSNLSLAAKFVYPKKINSSRNILVTNSLSLGGSAVIDTIFYADSEKGKISMPYGIGGGFLYAINEKFRFGADYMTQDWSKALFFEQSDSLGNSNSVNLGFEYTPVGIDGLTTNYVSKISYRFGMYFDQTYINFATIGEQINDFGISFGLGLPMKRSKTSFNVWIELGQKGTTKSNLVRERYLNLGLNFSLSDIWFVKRKFD
ncbi:MAG: hypothetical protein GX879_00715 [Bacteroidales bacterium]|nr:hypothetical protein [Bacteroidales bacterium]